MMLTHLPAKPLLKPCRRALGRASGLAGDFGNRRVDAFQASGQACVLSSADFKPCQVARDLAPAGIQHGQNGLLLCVVKRVVAFVAHGVGSLLFSFRSHVYDDSRACARGAA